EALRRLGEAVEHRLAAERRSPSEREGLRALLRLGTDALRELDSATRAMHAEGAHSAFDDADTGPRTSITGGVAHREALDALLGYARSGGARSREADVLGRFIALVRLRYASEAAWDLRRALATPAAL